MNIKNRFLKKLSISFVAVASMVGFTLTAQAAGGYEKIGKHVESKKKDIDEKLRKNTERKLLNML
ncbi:hypothetical protein ACTIGL_27995 (plasmid) [Bacillus shihchuchen]|uniref:Uncharacterized protein n=1 Tax=Bacillus shihchuchen TaxID=3036942 RepID=A0ABT7KZ23_9BACI|nr:hypothetical protein [Bacillus shihchuchen]